MIKKMLNDEMIDCIENCRECADTCLQTISHCLEQGGEHAEQQHIATLQVCADICQTSSRAMLLGSEHHAIICGACAEVCEICAEDCDRFGDDEMMQACVEAARRSAESCRTMAEGAAPVRRSA